LSNPCTIRTNLINSSTSAKKGLAPKFLYFSLMQKVENHFKLRMENVSSSSLPEVAKVILQAITPENPQLRYIVGTTIMQARMNMSDNEFRKMIMQSFSM
jgi:hypothetical protein